MIRYCPDEKIEEFANIGVLRYTSDPEFVGIRITSNNKRVARMFGGRIRKYDAFQRYKNGLAAWIKK